MPAFDFVEVRVTDQETKYTIKGNVNMFTADHGGYNLSTYALAILVHIYNSLINMGCLHILPHI